MSTTLHKNERLKSRKAIENLFRKGAAFNNFPYRIVYVLASATDNKFPLQAGFSASARKFKKAVDRNRIKRVTKEVYRIQKTELQQALLNKHSTMSLFFIYTAGELPVYSLVKEKITVILKKLIHVVNEKTTSDT